MTKQHKMLLRNAVLVAVALAVAYALRIILRPMSDPFLPTVLTVIRTVIHVTIAALWSLSLNRRIVNRQVRGVLVTVGVLMVFWLIAKTVKYEFFPHNYTAAGRYIWYCFYIPMIMIPLLGSFVNLFIDKPDNYRAPKWSYYFFIPAVILILCVLTNDLHRLVFVFPNGIENYDSDYSYGFLYWIIMAWYIGLAIAFVVLLIRKNRIPGSKKLQKLPLLIILGAITFWLLYTLKIINGDLTVIDCILIGALLETAIQSGLIHTNSSYGELFEGTTVPLIIVDGSYQPRYTSGGAMPVSAEAMRASANGTVALDGTLLSSTEIRGGRVLWQDDVRELERQREELNEVCERLSEEGVLIQAETEIKENQAKADEKNRLYDKLAREVKPQLAALDALLDKAERGEEVKESLARVAVMGSYVKRRGNLLLLGNEKDISLRELESALRESSECLKLLDVEVSLAVSGDGVISLDDAVRAYDTYERAVETVLDGMTAIFIRLISDGAALRLSLQIGVDDSITESCLVELDADGAVEAELDGGDLYVDLELGGDVK